MRPHLTFTTQGRLPIAVDEATRLAIVRTLIERAGESLALFCIVDEHAHVAVHCEKEATGRLARRLLFGIRGLASAPVLAAHVQPVEHRGHAQSLVPYLLRQTVHHGLDVHPALRSGSCFADLIGARWVDGWTWRIGTVLPRWRVREAYSAVGLGPTEIQPLAPEAVRAAGASRLVAAGRCAVAAGRDGNAPESALARRAAAVIGAEAGIRVAEVAAALGLTVDAVTRLRARPVDPRVLRAVRVRLALEEAVARLSR